MAKQNIFKFPHKFILWLIFIVIITGFCGLVYAAVQQDMRQGANDPQIQMAEDAAISLNAGQKVNSSPVVDIANSLAPFMIVYDSQGQVVSSSAVLHGQIPQIPPGIVDNVKRGGEERFTWQPEDDTRIAAIITQYNGGFVLAGRNIREVENREHKLMLQVAGVWIAAIGIVTVMSLLL